MVSWLLYVLAALWLLDAVFMRSRLAQIPILKPSEDPADPEVLFLSAAGVTLQDAVRSAAGAHARLEGLDYLDLLPANMPAFEAMRLARLVDPLTYRKNRIARGHSAGYASLAKRDLLERVAGTDSLTPDPVALGRLAETLKRSAPNRSGLAIAPGLNVSSSHAVNWQILSAVDGPGVGIRMQIRGLGLGTAIAGLLWAPAAGVIALAVYHLQILIVFAGLKLRPRDLLVTLLFRTPLEVMMLVRLARSYFGSLEQKAAIERVAARRPFYERMLAHGTQVFFEPRQETCPLCSSHELKVRLRTTDLLQGKPGRFILEQCVHCGHIFQNPRLSTAGLDFYYSDSYDGLGAEQTHWIFDQFNALYLQRARTVESVCSPKRWLDIGAGYGHFCCVAKDVWPHAEFHGVDIGPTIQEAARAGWVDQGYQGRFPDIAPNIAGQYDVVSFFHCLEHSPDPRAELAASRIALAAGGLLVIEVPDPESPFSRWLGRYWFPWLQPQHLHFLSAPNLERLLREEGLEPMRTYSDAHIGFDLSLGLFVFCNRLASEPNAPWRPPPSWFSYVRHWLVWNCSVPFFVLALILDGVLYWALLGLLGCNAFGVIARRAAKES